MSADSLRSRIEDDIIERTPARMQSPGGELARERGIVTMKKLSSVSLAFIYLALLLPAKTTAAPPCIKASTDCTEWVMLAAGSPRLLVYRSYPLSTRSESITRALIVVHGGGRDADDNFRTLLAAAFLAGALDDTVIVSPRFASSRGKQAANGSECRDALAPDEANWVCDVESPDSWRYGGVAIGTDKLSSYDLVDEILRKLARKDVFPNLRTIVVTGHSGGGMFSLRYAMANQVHDTLGVPVRYVPSNPTNYPYLDSRRSTANAYPVHAATPGYIPATPPQLAPFSAFADSRSCTSVRRLAVRPPEAHRLYGEARR